MFQPIGVEICTGIAYGFIPKYSCNNGGAATLPSCNNAASGQPCCTKASNMGWRYLLFTLGAITLVVFCLRFVVFRFQESPKFLLYRGRDDEAVTVLHNIARFNGRESTITTEVFAALADNKSSAGSLQHGKPTVGAGTNEVKATFTEKVRLELSRYKMLFSGATMARLTILVWITYMFDYWGFSVAGKQAYSACPCMLTDPRVLPSDHSSP